MVYTLEQLKKMIVPMLQSMPVGDEERLAKSLVSMIEQDRNTRSDGYHTFDELYEHRILLFIGLIAATDLHAWRSFKHDDGSKYDGWFIAGIDLPTGTITYHLPEKYWDMLQGYAEALDKAPKWDGHTPPDVIDRLTKWIQLEDRNA